MSKYNDRKIGKGGHCGVLSSGITGIINFRLNLSARATTRAKAPTARRIIKGKGAMPDLILRITIKLN
jgi:hypothetical protein